MGNQPSGTAGAPAAAAGPSTAAGGARPASATGVNYTQTQANGTGTATQARKPAETPVLLNVYEPAKPQGVSIPGFGIYHTGIELNGVEYTFAGSKESSGSGVQSQQPRATPDDGQWKFKETIPLGTVQIQYNEFDKVLNELKDAFPGNTYDLLHRNCNSFTLAVAKRLGVHSKYPGWINRAASWGSIFQAPPKNHKPLDLPPPKESVFKTSTGYRMDGSTVAPKIKTKESEAKKPEGTDKKQAQAAAASGSATKGRKNPWADPSFVPPGMRDPVVSGFAKPGEALPASYKPPEVRQAPAK